VVVFISLRAGVKLIIEWQMKEKAKRSQGECPPCGEEKN
jgi:ribosomal protein L37AE/L43A